MPEEAKDQLEVKHDDIPDHDILYGEAKHESEKENGEAALPKHVNNGIKTARPGDSSASDAV